MSGEKDHSGPQVENPHHLSLPDPAVAIFERMFAAQQRVVVRAELGSGFSGSRVFLVHPISDSPELPTVVKMAPAFLIEKEYRAYREHIHEKLSGAAEIRSKPTLIPGSDWGGLRYHLVGSGIFEVESLIDFLRHASIKDIWHVLEKRLFARIGPLWRFSSPSPQFSLQASYDRLLPVNLLLAPATPLSRAPTCLLTPDTLDSPPLERGDCVRVEGFVVEEVDLSGETLTLNLPPRNDGQPASFRLRLQAIGPGQAYRPGDVIDGLEGQVVATRYDLLAEQVEAVLGQEIVTAQVLSLPGDPEIGLPNPLAVLPAILGESRNVRIAGIHGDLNMENVLVDPDARDVALIDFGMARRDHVLHDLLRLETGVVTWLLPEILAEGGLPPEIICDLYEQVHHAARRSGHLSAPQALPSVLRKPFVILASVREMARECLYAPDVWEEYYQSLTLYLTGALKFKNLDAMPFAPLPKQVAFWGAAAAQRLLQEQPRYDEATWQSLSAILDDLTGQTLGQYEITTFVDQGSMGAVYRARQPRLQRDVAIKVMSPALAADADFRQRFEREAQSIAGLHHPNILTVHDYGETEEGCPYLVVDYVEGGTLRDRLITSQQAKDRMPLEEVIEILAQVADALDYAHRQGVVHRDVKPNNILLSHDGRPLLADFGLAKPVQGDRRLTSTGVILGTPDYMAPEQAQGSAVDGRADVYALGVMLFEMLTGRHPFAGETPIGVIIKHISEPLPCPSEIAPTIPSRLDEVVARATAKRPEERYQQAGDLARALRSALVPRVMREETLGTPTRVGRLPRALRRRGLLWTGGAVIAVALAAVSVWWFSRSGSPLTEPPPTNPISTILPTRTPTLVPTATSIPLPVWRKLYDGAVFGRDYFSILAVDPQNSNVMYAGTEASGIYKSLDGGSSWQHLYSNPRDRYTWDMVIDPDDPRTLYAIWRKGGLQKTVDGGLTWESIGPDATPSISFRLITLASQDSQHLYLECKRGTLTEIYESRDGGVSWKTRATFDHVRDWVVDPQDDDRVYVSSFKEEQDQYDSRIYRSDGPGAEWQEIWQSSAEWPGVYLAVTAGDPPTLYVLDEESFLHRSQDSGVNWIPVGETPCTSQLAADLYAEQVLYCLCGDLGIEVRVSLDGGLSWKDAWPFLAYFVVPGPDRQAIYTASSLGLLTSPDKGMTWHILSLGPGIGRLEIQVDPRDGATLYALGKSHTSFSDTLYRSQDGGSTWQEVPTERSEGLAINPIDGALYRFDRDSNEIYRSTDGGQTWTTPAPPTEKAIEGVAVHPQNGSLYALHSLDAYVSTDDGLTWEQIGQHWLGDRLYFDYPQGNIMYLMSYSSVYQSTDGGWQWNECGSIGGSADNSIIDLAIDPSDSRRIFVATSETGVWVSESNCTMLETRNEGLESLLVNGIAIHPTDPDVIYAATYGGVYVSRDGGRQWKLADEGLQGATVAYDVAIDPNEPHNIYVATPLGIFRLETP
jgi:serine/threonine protein kinase/photosystem II stability/assembly factor-like uncharacterized protein